MSFSKFLNSVLASMLAVASLAGCVGASSNLESDPSVGAPGPSAAYTRGFEGNMGVTPNLINQAGGAEPYCRAMLGFVPDFTDQEKADYVQGCLDVIGAAPPVSGDSNPNPDPLSELEDRLSSQGLDGWRRDKINLFNPPPGYLATYLAKGPCTLWVFENEDAASTASNGGFLNGFDTYYWAWGTDEQTGLGVIAMYESTALTCADDMVRVLNWFSLP